MKQLPIEALNILNSQQLIPDIKSLFKELIENSIDANATKIEIDLHSSNIQKTKKKSLIDKIYIKDNGTGIPYEYFPTICKRHFTSKINNYEDLQTCKTFGYRGEALHGISFMSNLSIISNHNSDFGIQFDFVKGQLIGDFEDPKVVNREQGTTIMVNDIFSDNQTKKSIYLKSLSVTKSLENLIKKFAIQYYNIDFEVRLNNKVILNLKT